MEAPVSNDEVASESSGSYYDQLSCKFGCDKCAAFFMARWITKSPMRNVMWDKKMPEYYWSNKKLNDMIMEEWEKHNESHKKKTHGGNGRYAGPWAFTLTMSPKDPQSIGDMLTAVKKIMQQKTKPVIKYSWRFEHKGFDEMGGYLHPHIHGMYETEDGGRIPRRQWERVWSLWDEDKPMGAGFRGGYHRPVKSEEGYADYIVKDGGMGESMGVDQ